MSSSIHVEIPMVARALGSGQKTPERAGKNKHARPTATASPVQDTPYKPPTPDQQMKQAATSAKVSAVHSWVRGDISTQKHNQIHARANRVLSTSRPSKALGKKR